MTRPVVERAHRILGNEEALPQGQPLRDLVDELNGVDAANQGHDFGLSRKLLERARARGDADVWIVQQLAFATYKDEELVPSPRFRGALVLLESIGLGDPQLRNGETLGLGGAVYKRMWEFGGLLEHLHMSLALYRAAWERGDVDDDRLYGVGNAAFLLDVLAARARVIARRGGTPLAQAEDLARQARGLREDALALLKKLADADAAQGKAQPYWRIATRAEALFGLGLHDEAQADFARAAAMVAPGSWKLQSSAKQLLALARVLPAVPPPPRAGTPRAQWPAAWRALGALCGERADRIFGNHRGKVGLALSGGGFRASLYHLGVLARLAEMDVLRHVEALSTVSGGSIVGAHYYLAVKKRLEDAALPEPGRDDYVRIVDDVIAQFCAGVGHNLRMRTMSGLAANLKMAFRKGYTRSHRLGELYEEHFYAQVGDRAAAGGHRMADLRIVPAGEAPGFKPKFGNWWRGAKVPVLMLNATSLNSGHNWQFTANWMGEPPEAYDAGIDMNARYRRLYYTQAPEPELKAWPLGHAVAASACVPGLFEPLVLDKLYPGRTVRLVDGGVHDNQGVEGLLAEGCTLVLASDASGQMEDELRPPDGRLGVPLRSNGILMDRVREAQYQDLRARVASRSLQGLFFVHLKQELDPAPLDWIDCQDPTVPPQTITSTTAYGIDKTLQRQLAAIRTDLDSFSEVEAQLLMLSGYLMTEAQFGRLQADHERSGEDGTWGDFDVHAPRGEWDFLRLEALARLPPGASDARRAEVARLLDASPKLFFRVWGLSPLLARTALVAGVAAAVGVVAWIARHWQVPLPWPQVTLTVGQAALALLAVVAGALFPASEALQPQKAAQRRGRKAALAVGLWLASRLHLAVFDRLFLHLGRVQRLLRLQ